MGIAGYVTVCLQLYCVSCHCLTLHVSAYMTIFKCVGYFYFHVLEGFSFAAFFLPFFHVVTLCMFSICVFPLFSFVSFVVSLHVRLSACFSFVFFLCFPLLVFLFPCVCVCLHAFHLCFSSVFLC
jgi:hypothetical protein